VEKRVVFKSVWLPWVLIAPQVLVITVFFFWPAAQALLLSVQQSDAFGTSVEWVGLDNFRNLWKDETYLASFYTTAIFSTLVAVLGIGLSLILAVFADRIVKGALVYKTLLIWPYAVAWVVAFIPGWLSWQMYAGSMKGFPDRFVAAFGQVPATALEARERSKEAIAAFVAAQVTGPSAFDRWASGQGELTREARLGLGLFIGAGRCNVCHAGPRFTDDKFHNTGIPGNVSRDRGRFDVSGQAGDRGAFKTPGLRNVAHTAPYFHDGSARTLGQALRHYEGVDPLFENLSTDLEPRSINGVQDAAFLEDFLRSLTGATPSLMP
jgi:hypothetical protein